MLEAADMLLADEVEVNLGLAAIIADKPQPGPDDPESEVIGPGLDRDSEPSGPGVPEVELESEAPQTIAEIEEDRIYEALDTKYDAQEADQYIKLIYIPTALALRTIAIIDDHHIAHFATTAMTASSMNLANTSSMGYMDAQA